MFNSLNCCKFKSFVRKKEHFAVKNIITVNKNRLFSCWCYRQAAFYDFA